MSTKTLRKRIALVAVTALGAGVLSVAPASAVETAVNDGDGIVHVSGSICAASNLIGGAPTSTDGSADTSPFESGSAAGKILIVPVGGRLVIDTDAADAVTITGPLSIGTLLDTAGTLLSVATIVNGKVVVTGNAADSDFVLNASAVGTATLVVAAAGATDPTPTAANTIKVSIVAACATTTISLATTLVSVEDASDAAVDNVDLSAVQANTESGFLSIVGKNAYGVAVPTGTWIVSATNGALVGIAAGTATAGDTSMASVSNTGADIRVAVALATAGVAQSSV